VDALQGEEWIQDISGSPSMHALRQYDTMEPNVEH
jgi:hypothetical protein